MRARHVLLSFCISVLPQVAAATESDELPPLELLGFIADFSDEEEGWVDPQELDEMLSLDGGKQGQEERAGNGPTNTIEDGAGNTDTMTE